MFNPYNRNLSVKTIVELDVGTNEITYKEKTLNKTLSMFSFRKKFQTCIPKEFETFHFSRVAVDVLNKTEE